WIKDNKIFRIGLITHPGVLLNLFWRSKSAMKNQQQRILNSLFVSGWKVDAIIAGQSIMIELFRIGVTGHFRKGCACRDRFLAALKNKGQAEKKNRYESVFYIQMIQNLILISLENFVQIYK